MALDLHHHHDKLTAMRESVNNLRGAGAVSDKALKLVKNRKTGVCEDP